jgi:hypothetical protein
LVPGITSLATVNPFGSIDVLNCGTDGIAVLSDLERHLNLFIGLDLSICLTIRITNKLNIKKYNNIFIFHD